MSDVAMELATNTNKKKHKKTRRAEQRQIGLACAVLQSCGATEAGEGAEPWMVSAGRRPSGG